jgi:2-methylcitrate dehydratase
MAMVDELAAFVVATKYNQLSEAARLQAKIRMLDALGYAIAAMDADPICVLAA